MAKTKTPPTMRDLPIEQLFDEARWALRDATRSALRAAEEAHAAEALLMVVAESDSQTNLPSERLEAVSQQLSSASTALRAAEARWETIAMKRRKNA